MDRNLNDILVFVQVVESGSFTAAGRLLSLPTSTVSRRISRLEERLGSNLLHRTTRRLSLTDSGRIFYDRGARAVAEIAAGEQDLAETMASPKGRVRVTGPSEQSLFGGLIPPFLAKYPDVRVELDLSNRTVNLVEEGYDVAIHAGALADSGLIAVKLMDSTFIVVGAPSYIKAQGAPKAPGDLGAHTCIPFGVSSTEATWTLEGPRGVIKVPVRGRFAVNHLGVVRDAALGGLGIAMLPEMVAKPHLAEGSLAHLLPDFTGSPVPISLVYPGGRHLSPAVRAFLDFAKSQFKSILEQTTPGWVG